MVLVLHVQPTLCTLCREKRIIMLRFGLFLLALAVLSTRASADTDGLKKSLVQQLNQLAEKEVSLRGGIESEETPSNEGGILGGIQAGLVKQATSSVLNQGQEYFGEFEIHITPNKDIAFVSEQGKTSLEFYSTETKFTCTQTHGDTPFTPNLMVFQLAKLLDWKALAKGVEESTKVRDSSKGESTDLRVVMDRDDLAPPGLQSMVGNAMLGIGGRQRINVSVNPLAPSVVDFTAIFTMNSKQELVGITYELQMDDPMKEMMNRGNKQQPLVPRALRRGKQDKENDEDIVLGKLVRYEFDLVKDSSERLAKYVEDAKSRVEAKSKKKSKKEE
jgi:hypothetical protein